MSELSYKELQEQGVFGVPYRAFKYMQSQQAKIDELQGRIDKALHAADESCGVSVAAFVRLNNILKAVEK